MKMKAAVVRGYNEPVTVEEVDLAPPKEKEVLVKTAYCGFCHSDLSLIKGHFKFPLPAVMGHEASGLGTSMARAYCISKSNARMTSASDI